MDTEPTPPARKVPEELLEKLHEATDHFQKGKEKHEATLDDTEYRHEERVEETRDELQNAEHELEEVTEEIKKELDKPL